MGFLGVFLLVVLILLIFIYNGLVAKKNKVEESESDIDVMLKKRFDLIPNLVETVKAYMSHERETLVELTELRSQAQSGGLSTSEQNEIASKVSRMGRGLMIQVENYPDLKASNNFLQLQASWNEVEEQLSASRRGFNAAVNSYNNGLEQFPSNLMAQMMNYVTKDYIDVPEEEKGNTSAKELFNN
jgi:LemA protein